jgi:hypothetical protein
VKTYYDRRAPEYDEWYLGLCRFDGLERPHWDDEVGSRWEVFKRYFTGNALARVLGGGEILHGGPWFVVVRSTA